jgi:hypothetical protein
MIRVTLLALAVVLLAGCSPDGGKRDAPESPAGLKQPAEALLAGEVMAVAYSGYREGQHPDLGEGAANPSREQILEDLRILVDHGFRLIRVYDVGENTVTTLELIREHELPIKVLLGIWLDAEISNHEGCPWLDEPIPEEKLAANKRKNAAENGPTFCLRIRPATKVPPQKKAVSSSLR